MKRLAYVLLAATLLSMIGMANTANAGGSRIGGGLHYLRNLADIQDDSGIDWDNNSFGIIGSFQHQTTLLKLEADVEYVFNYAGTDEAMWIPSGWALLGQTIYAGAGIGVGYIDGEWQNDPFYALRAGVDLPLGGMSLDVFGTYQFQKDEDFEDLTGEDLDSVTFAAVLRFPLGN
jgi:hypothetical protein